MFMEIGQYLNQRLVEMGIGHVFGVPGDFNLSYLEQLEQDTNLAFIGNCNELNAAYAADGYARQNGVAALLTTYGVGDLSAINGIAGAYAEGVALVHISGIPPLHAVNSGALLHHTLVDGNYQNIMQCMREFTVAQTRLSPSNAVAEIDRVLKQCVLQQRPVHIQLPSDITHIRVEVNHKALDLSPAQTDPVLLQQTVTQILAQLKQAKRPILLLDHPASTWQLTEVLQQWAEQLNLPYACLNTTKNIMDEASALFAGVYVGAANPQTQVLVEQSDCVIAIGVRFTDVATAFFSQKLHAQQMISLNRDTICIGEQQIVGVGLSELCHALLRRTQQLPQAKINIQPQPLEPVAADFELEQALSHAWLWQQIAPFIRADDVIVAEIGTANAGLSSLVFPKSVDYIAQPIWGSIGYTLPALLGSMLAAPKRRHLLFIGDGSIQLTIQELSTILRLGLKPIIFVLNNGGYTIERLIMGENARYNDVQNWQYSQFAQVFAANQPHQAHVVHTHQQLSETLNHVQVSQSLCLIELKLQPMDAPERLKQFGQVVARYDYGDYGYTKLNQPKQIDYQDAI